jgi:uncharacterized membrane protein YgcG
MATVCLFFASTTPAAAAHTIESTFVADGIIIDGTTEDWGGWPVVYLEDSLRVFGVSHDQDNLYIMYRFGDARVAEQLLRRSVVLWINGDGKKKNKNDAFGVRYAGSEEIEASLEATRTTGEETSERHRSPHSGMGPPEGTAPMESKVGALTVIRDGIKEIIEETDSRFQAASNAVDGVYAYELRIPLDEIGGKVAATSAAKHRKLAVGVQLGGLSEAEKELIESRMSEMREQRSDKRGGTGGRGGGMGGRGGGMGGGSRPGGSGGGRPTLDAEIDWLVVELPPTTE